MRKPKKLPRGVSFHATTERYFGRKTVVLRNGLKERITTPYVRSATEASDLLDKAVRQAEALDPERRTVEDFLGEWFAHIAPDGPFPRKPRVRQATYALRLQVLAPLLPPSLATGKRASHPAFEALRAKLLRDFDEVDLREFSERFAATGAGSRSVQLAYESLRTAWRFAAQRRYVDVRENPFARVDRPEHIPEPREPLSTAQVSTLLAAIRATKVQRSRTLLLLLATTGLRISEALALQWENVDLAEGSVKVRAQLSESGELAPLKTPESRREVWPVPEVMAALTTLRKKAASECWVFETKGSHRPLDRNNVRSKVLRPMLKRAGLEDAGLTIHDLRSLAATLIAPSVDSMTLCMMFGWTNVNTAKRFYVRANDATRGAGRDAMAGALARIGKPTDISPAEPIGV